MDIKEKIKIKNQLIFNWVLIFILSLVTYYLFNQYSDLSVKMDEANKLFSYYNQIKNNWIDINDLARVSAKFWQNKEIVSALNDKERLKWIITKSDKSADYPTWLNIELSKESKNQEEKLKNENIIWNILPIFYQYWDWTLDNKWKNVDYQITLDNFTSFVENKLLKAHNISSYSTIWMDNIVFDNQWWKNNMNSSSVIWSFFLNLDFQWSNKDIASMIEFIQNSWKLDIQNWKLINKNQKNSTNNLSMLDNLLMTIDNLSIKSPILESSEYDSTGKLIKNTWSIKIRFYVRWLWFEQLTNIKSRSIKKITDLQKTISNKATICEKWNNPLCKDWVWSEAVATLRSYLKDIIAIKSKVDSKTKIVPWKDMNINQELSDWLSIASSIDSIEASCLKAINYIDNFKKTWAK